MRLRKPASMIAIGITLLLFNSVVIAEPPTLETAKKAGCLACHSIQNKLIGPAFSWVAYKYRDDKKRGREIIIEQIIKGSSRKWIRYTGGIQMPPYGKRTTASQREALADFILGLEPMAPPRGL